MRTMFFEDRLPGSYTLNILPDVHERVLGFSTSGLAKLRAQCKKVKNWFVVGGGDYVDFMHPQDTRFKFGGSEPKAQRQDQQKYLFLKDFEWIRGHCLYLLNGNHDSRAVNVNDLTRELWVALDIPDPPNIDTETSVNLIKSDFGSWRMLHWHPYKGALNSNAQNAEQRYRNECNSLALRLDRLGHRDAIVAVANHYHKIRIRRPSCAFKLQPLTVGKTTKARYYEPIPKIVDAGKKIYYYDYDDRTFASNGALFGGYVENHQGYVEEAGYEPTDMGYLQITVKNDKYVGIDAVGL